MIVFIGENGHLCLEENAKYKVTLTGEYRYSPIAEGYWYKVSTIEPYSPVGEIYSPKLLKGA